MCVCARARSQHLIEDAGGTGTGSQQTNVSHSFFATVRIPLFARPMQRQLLITKVQTREHILLHTTGMHQPKGAPIRTLNPFTLLADKWRKGYKGFEDALKREVLPLSLPDSEQPRGTRGTINPSRHSTCSGVLVLCFLSFLLGTCFSTPCSCMSLVVDEGCNACHVVFGEIEGMLSKPLTRHLRSKLVRTGSNLVTSAVQAWCAGRA
eukprot:1147467-Pelagomonas_calceolata.AAC.1